MERIQKHSNSLPYLPPEIIEEIVTRMEVKALLKFRCVSKSWLSLISSSQFVKTHLNLASRKPTLLLTLYDTNFRYFTCPLSSFLANKTSFNPKILDFHLNDYNGKTKIVGISNGLFCLKIDHAKLVLYNPSTRNFKYLSPSPTKGERCKSFAYGFGYDHETDDYKIVELYDYYNEEAKLNTKIEIYSLRKNSWRTLLYPCGVILCARFGTCIGGVIYWFNYISEKILSIDIVKYKYSTLEGPKFDGTSGVEGSLGEFGKCLASFYCNMGIGVDGSVMKEASWTKMASITWPKESHVSSSVYVESLVVPSFDGDGCYPPPSL